MRIRIFLVPLLLAFSASAQTLIPARQVSANTNGWGSVAPTAETAQASFDWIDLNWMRVSTSSWSAIFPDDDTVQAAFDYLDASTALAPTNWNYLLGGTNLLSRVSAQTVFDWLDAYQGIPTSGWTALAPANRFGVAGETSLRDLANWLDDNWVRGASDISVSTNNWSNALAAATAATGLNTNTVQSVFEGIDDWMGYLLGTSLPANYVRGTNLFGFSYSPTNKTWTQYRVGVTAQSQSNAASWRLPSASWYYNYTWRSVPAFLTDEFEFTGNGTVSGGTYTSSNAAYYAPYPGAYFVSASASFRAADMHLYRTNFPVGVGVYHSAGGGASGGAQYRQLADVSSSTDPNAGTNSIYVDVSLGRIVHMEPGESLGYRVYSGGPPAVSNVYLQNAKFDVLWLSR